MTTDSTKKGKVIKMRKKHTKRDGSLIGIAKLKPTQIADWTPTENERFAVKTMIAGGMKLEDIALCINPAGPISVHALKQKFKDEVRHGRASVTKDVITVLTKMALSGKHPAVTIFWLKTQAGWKESGGGTGAGHKFGVSLDMTEEVTRKLQQTAKMGADTLPKRKTGTDDK